MLYWLRRFAADESGQDLIEYALLTAFLALAGYVGFTAVSGAQNGSYSSWDQSNWNLWQVPPPH
jgi:Flp pilus assembly pilin Flp